MSILLMAYWTFIANIAVVHSAPKIGDVYFDPLIFESPHDYLSNEMLAPNFRRNISPLPKETLFDGYLFDQDKCQLINGRILCGYDKNKGTYLNEETFYDLGNGCRSRGDRIECGYGDKNNLRLINKTKIHAKGNIKHFSNARPAPTRTTMFDTTTPDTIIVDSQGFAPNKLVKSVLEAILEKPVIENVRAIKSAEIFDLPSTTSSSVIENINLPIASETPTLSTTSIEIAPSPNVNHESKLAPETTFVTTVIPKTTESSSTSTSIITDYNSISSSETDFLDNDISSSDYNKRIIKMPFIESRLVSKILSTVSEATSNTQTDNRYERETTTNENYLRVNTEPNEKFTTACVENGGRLVCYDFQT